MPFKSSKIAKFILISTVICIGVISGWFLVPRHAATEQPLQASTPTDHVIQETPLEKLLSIASVERGRKLSHTCIECHTFDEDGPNRFGPNLFGIYGAPHAHKKDYVHSDALKAMSDRRWDAEKLDAFLNSPKLYVPGTKMLYPGVPSAQDRADIIVYLKTLNNN